MIERLTEKYNDEVLGSFPWSTLGDEDHIRWWVKAIADELEREFPWSTHNNTVVRRLRAQTQEHHDATR